MTDRTKRLIAELDAGAQPFFNAMCGKLDAALGDDSYTVYEGLRSKTVQEAYFAQGRESLAQVNEKRKAAGLYPLAGDKQNYKITWTMNSKHLSGLAMDILPVDGRGNPTWDLAHYRGRFEEIVRCGREAGLVCGADWPEPQQDWPHYEAKDA
jgi:hypothetical protein